MRDRLLHYPATPQDPFLPDASKSSTGVGQYQKKYQGMGIGIHAHTPILAQMFLFVN
jgi:hypothetical protein